MSCDLLNKFIQMSHRICNVFNVSRPSSLWVDAQGKPFTKLTMRRWFNGIIQKVDPSFSFFFPSISLCTWCCREQLDTRGLYIESIMNHMSRSSSSTFIKFIIKALYRETIPRYSAEMHLVRRSCQKLFKQLCRL